METTLICITFGLLGLFVYWQLVNRIEADQRWEREQFYKDLGLVVTKDGRLVKKTNEQTSDIR